MRNISFSMTTQAFIEHRKTVTRRLGWWNLKPGDILMGVEKSQGLKKGEKVKRLGRIIIISAKKEFLFEIRMHDDDCFKEGLPELTPAEFEKRFCDHNNCNSSIEVNRIEFEYL
jgi:hypothetical protein